MNDFSNRIHKLSTYPNHKIYDSINKICTDLDKVDYKLDKPSIIKLKSIAKSADIHAYIFVNAFFAKYYTDELNQLNYAYNLASKNNLKELMGWIQVSKSEYFKVKEQYDSSLVCILKAKNHYKQSNKFDSYVAILHTIGDLYFKAGMYENAQKQYNEIFELKGDRTNWYNWRERVIVNNLGLIALRQKNYDVAIDKFSYTLNKELTRKGGYQDNNVLAYSYNLLAEAYFEKGFIDTALKHCNKGIDYALSGNHVEFMADLYLLKSKCLMVNGYSLEALRYVNLSTETFTLIKYSSAFDYKLHTHLGNLYQVLNDSTAAANYKKKAVEIKQSFTKRTQQEAYIKTLNALSEQSDKKEGFLVHNKWIIWGAFILLFSFIIFWYIKIKKGQ